MFLPLAPPLPSCAHPLTLTDPVFFYFSIQMNTNQIRDCFLSITVFKHNREMKMILPSGRGGAAHTEQDHQSLPLSPPLPPLTCSQRRYHHQYHEYHQYHLQHHSHLPSPQFSSSVSSPSPASTSPLPSPAQTVIISMKIIAKHLDHRKLNDNTCSMPQCDLTIFFTVTTTIGLVFCQGLSLPSFEYQKW